MSENVLLVCIFFQRKDTKNRSDIKCCNFFLFCFLWKLETVGKYSSSYFAKFNTSIVSVLNTYSYIVNMYVCVFVYVCVTLTMCG